VANGTRGAERLPTAPVVLLLIDVVNPMDFDGAERLLPAARTAAARIAPLAARARAAGVPVIYVNDNFDCWHLGFHELIEKFEREGVPGLPIIRTGLEVLLRRLHARTLVLTGFAADICVLFTANDAYMRGFRVVVPADCVASEREEDNAHALRHMARLLKAEVTASSDLDLERLGAAA